MKRTGKFAACSVLNIVLGVPSTDAAFSISGSTRAQSMMTDLQTMSQVRPDTVGSETLSSFFDQGSRVTVSQPVISVVTPAQQFRQRDINPNRTRPEFSRPVTRNPATQLWLNMDPRLTYAGQGQYFFTPPPPRIYAYPPNPYPYDNRGFGIDYPYPGYQGRFGNRQPGYGYPDNPGYPGYHPPYPGSPYPGYPPFQPEPSLGDKVLDGVRWFFNSLETGFNNLRASIARWIEPESPYITDHIYVPDAFGRKTDIPIYRFRPEPIDFPGQPDYGYGGGYDPSFPGQGGGYGYPGYGFPPYDDGGRRGTFGQPGYRYVPEYGYAPDFGFKDGYRFVPGQGVIP